MRAIIVEDERHLREMLRDLSEGLPDLEIVGEASSGFEALELIREIKPDLLFLDVQMPGLDGFQLLERLPIPSPKIIFTTAYDEYAVRAFEARAVDYLLKPFTRSRLQQAVAQAANIEAGITSSSRREDIKELVAEIASKNTLRYPLKVGTKTVFVRIDKIEWIQAQGDYAAFHVGKETYLVREKMNVLEQKLDPRAFVRIHRSAIVNIAYVKQVEPLSGGDCSLKLADGTELILGRNHKKVFQERVRFEL